MPENIYDLGYDATTPKIENKNEKYEQELQELLNPVIAKAKIEAEKLEAKPEPLSPGEQALKSRYQDLVDIALDQDEGWLTPDQLEHHVEEYHNTHLSTNSTDADSAALEPEKELTSEEVKKDIKEIIDEITKTLKPYQVTLEHLNPDKLKSLNPLVQAELKKFMIEITYIANKLKVDWGELLAQSSFKPNVINALSNL